MAEQISLKSPDRWHEVLCTHVYEAQCLEAADNFKIDFTLSRTPEAQLSRIRGVAHRWRRTEKHLRGSTRESIVFHLQLNGASVQSQDKRKIILRPGDLVCTDSTRPVEVELLGEFTQLLVHVPRSLVVDSFGPTERFTCQELRHTSAVGFMLASYLDSVDAVLDDVSEQAAESLSKIATSLITATLAEMLATELDHTSWPRQAALYRAQLFIRANCRNPELTPTEVAAALKMSVRYLQTLFRDFGKTPSDYLWECRLTSSKNDLENPALRSLPIGEIAWRNGFVDVSHFSNRFRQAYGVAPRAVRQRLGSEDGRFEEEAVGVSTLCL
jgi:AraC-like DNA-binding protein